MRPSTFTNVVSSLLYEKRWVLSLSLPRPFSHRLIISNAQYWDRCWRRDTVSCRWCGFFPSCSHTRSSFLDWCLVFDCRFGPYYVEPLIAGLEEDGTPFIASTDLIGCPLVCTDFVVGGTCTEQLYGMCEALHNPDMGPDELFEAISQALLNAQDRDALSGWGGVVHIM